MIVEFCPEARKLVSSMASGPELELPPFLYMLNAITPAKPMTETSAIAVPIDGNMSAAGSHHFLSLLLFSTETTSRNLKIF